MSGLSVSFNTGAPMPPSAAAQLDIVARALRSDVMTTCGQAAVILGDLPAAFPDLAEHLAPHYAAVRALAFSALGTAKDLEALARACRRLGI